MNINNISYLCSMTLEVIERQKKFLNISKNPRM